MKTTIYYFTATGNCLDVAQNIQKSLEETELISIPALNNNKIVTPTSEKIGFVFPVYDYGIPLAVKDFLNKLNLCNVNYVFAVVTCNCFPGLALDRVDSILKEKEKKLNSGFVIKMPGNYIAMYGANSEKTQKKKFKQKDKKIITIIDCVRNCKDYGIEKSKFIIDRLLAPKLEKLIDNFPAQDSNFWVDNNCTGCGICSQVCAFDNIKIIDGKPQWHHKCQQCFACIHLCPKASLQIGKSSMNRKRYKNPNVSLQDIINSNNLLK
jgi:ferredoxin/flavodoxin